MSRLVIFASLLSIFIALVLATSASAANYIVGSEFVGTLQEAVDTAGSGGMVIVDQPYVLDRPLVLPRFFRLVGMGPQGQGSIAYTRDSGAAIQFAGVGTTSAVVIENLDIEGIYPVDPAGTSIGIAMAEIHHVYLNNVTVRGFDIGIVGKYAFYIHIRDSNVSLNQSYNYHLIDNANSWRITGGSSSQSGLAAIRVETSNNTVIEGVSFESNQVGVYTSTESTHVFNNRFECSPAIPMFCFGNPIGVHIDAGANLTTLVGNYYSGLDPLLDTSGDGLSYRFDHDDGAFIRPTAGAEGLRIELATVGDQLIFDADGRLQVGDTAPGSTARLQVDAPVGDEALRVGVNGQTDLFVGANGQVGVGTTTPTETLHVDGNLFLDGDLVTTGVLCIGSGC